MTANGHARDEARHAAVAGALPGYGPSLKDHNGRVDGATEWLIWALGATLSPRRSSSADSAFDDSIMK
jgi:hypothetical protein